MQVSCTKKVAANCDKMVSRSQKFEKAICGPCKREASKLRPGALRIYLHEHSIHTPDGIEFSSIVHETFAEFGYKITKL